ncbi:Hsp20/alpha crystallin family protein [Corynebacterium pyruviciproducens]|uniref:Hsp20/alpha crystallin family protein n=1 Tax=Corynebacterium pyruviciproducens TaxID=598660 RepID=UPI00288BE230|nr:Hsp20/alpha crystallin family protein [Corynebacterium pyruviciproducens]
MADFPRWNPFAELVPLQRAFFGDDWGPAHRSDWPAPRRGVESPTTDVYTSGDKVVVEAHLPDFSKDDIDLDLDGRVLTISASRHSREEDKDRNYVIRESSESFRRSVTLPEGVNTDDIQASLDNGVLTVTVPTPQVTESKRKIEITGGDSALKTIESDEDEAK